MARLQHIALHAVDHAAGPAQQRRAMTEAECDQPPLLGLAHPADERLDHARSGAPCDMEARYRIAVAGRKISAALRPADNRENAQALLSQPGALLPRGEIPLGPRPPARP